MLMIIKRYLIKLSWATKLIALTGAYVEEVNKKAEFNSLLLFYISFSELMGYSFKIKTVTINVTMTY